MAPPSIVRSLMLLSWVAYPLLALAVSFGCGLVVERIGGWRMPGVIVAGVGLCVVIVVAYLVTESTLLAPWTPWVVLALALIGYALSVPRLRALRPDWWQVVLGLVLFAVYAAPIVTSGHPTFSAYNIDGDPAFHFLDTLQLLAHGHRPLADLPNPGPYVSQLGDGYVATDYPFGADLAAGVFAVLTGTQLTWIYAPFIALVMTFGGLTIDELLRDVVRPRALRALCAFVAAQAGLAYSFALISSIKELATTWAITLVVVLVVALLRRAPSVRALAPLAVVTAAAIDILAVPAVPWLVPPLGAFAVLSLWRLRPQLRRAMRQPSRAAVMTVGWTALAVLVTVALAWPILNQASTSFSTTTTVLGASTNAGSPLGELIAPLNLWQILGIWPSGDFREPLGLHITLIHVLLYVTAASAIAGAAWAAWRRHWGLVLLMLGNGAVMWILYARSTPYAQSKVMAILTITALLAAMLGAVALHDRVHPALGWLLAVVLTAGVLWTNDKDLRQAPLAPYGRFAALTRIDDHFRGDGPTFYNLWDEEYPAFFLRKLDPTIPGIFAQASVRPGTSLPIENQVQGAWDPNIMTLPYVQSFKLLILGRSPTTARPPANFRLVYQDPWFLVYRRENEVKVLRHFSVTGNLLHKNWRLSCRRIKRIGARAAREHARLAYVPNPVVASVQASAASTRPVTWVPYPGANTPVAGALKLSRTGGTLRNSIRVPGPGTYTVWLGGAISQKISVDIGGIAAGSVSDQIGPGGMVTKVGTVHLPGGRQTVVMNRQAAPRFSASSENDSLGSLILTRTSGPAQVRTIAPSAAASLCHTPLQWLEVVR
jgi:hypothetical protein